MINNTITFDENTMHEIGKGFCGWHVRKSICLYIR